jgi:hypothetical protein
MNRLREFAVDRPALTAAAVLAGICLAVVASFTRPFTLAADVATAVPIALAVLALAVRSRPTDELGSVHAPGGEAPNGEEETEGPQGTSRPAPASRWSLLCAGLVAVIGSWELYNYLSVPRSQHPTLSSLIDLLDGTHVGKTIAFGLWLALGCYLVWR